MKYQVRIEDTGETYSCDERESILTGMARLGRKGIPLGCRGGGCGVCKVQVVEGEFVAASMSRAHVSEQEQAVGTVLACRIMPHSNLAVQVVGKMKKTVCREQQT
ncbi:MAG TPA: ferredoxin [Pseudomonas sp.]|jgi:ferredoxin|nr:ferredoxin [Pseudomonas sp.]HCP02083.1 ferredoxin [Pseudomonas sp.]|tara:strand:- start:1024 stop:1338 length:315 start_codon:yes stop_codon:yes gene_type:complete